MRSGVIKWTDHTSWDREIIENVEFDKMYRTDKRSIHKRLNSGVMSKDVTENVWLLAI